MMASIKREERVPLVLAGLLELEERRLQEPGLAQRLIYGTDLFFLMYASEQYVSTPAKILW
jgi:hypothetical protein